MIFRSRLSLWYFSSFPTTLNIGGGRHFALWTSNHRLQLKHLLPAWVWKVKVFTECNLHMVEILSISSDTVIMGIWNPFSSSFYILEIIHTPLQQRCNSPLSWAHAYLEKATWIMKIQRCGGDVVRRERVKGLQVKQEITLPSPHLPPAPTHMTYLVNMLYLSEQMFFIQMCRIQVSSYAFSLLS